MQEVNIKDYVKKMIPILAKQMNITMDSLCFCGSKEKYKDCCFQKSEDDLVFCEGSFEKVIKYRDSQGGKIEKVPLGIWGEMKEESLNRLKCLYP
ncbi:SEC-C domain-containing protein [Patescibacteria group bacterium]|nr:SEC-C domain-containing protein [Patescibacteria group bacterium]MBU1758615.1 SEC-C domain-containing protein [Patescibacteria group bacterium]